MKRRIRLVTALIVVNIAFIWGNSLLPGEISGALSDWLASLLGGGQVPQEGTGLLRKLAHFSEFGCLGFLLGLLAWLKGERGHHLISLALLGGLLTACADESIQLLTPDRGPSLVDVWIDTCGVAAGIAMLFVIKNLKNMISGGNKQ